jgi:chaperonin GroES
LVKKRIDLVLIHLYTLYIKIITGAKTMQLNPLHDRVVVQRTEPDTKTLGGIIIPDNVAEKTDQGTVVAVGPGRRTEDGTLVPMAVQLNDKVLFGKHSGQTVKIEGKEILILTEDEIFAVIE